MLTNNPRLIRAKRTPVSAWGVRRSKGRAFVSFVCFVVPIDSSGPAVAGSSASAEPMADKRAGRPTRPPIRDHPRHSRQNSFRHDQRQRFTVEAAIDGEVAHVVNFRFGAKFPLPCRMRPVSSRVRANAT